MRVLANPIQFSTKKFSLSFSLSVFLAKQSSIQQIEKIDACFSLSLSHSVIFSYSSLCVYTTRRDKNQCHEVTSLFWREEVLLIFFSFAVCLLRV
jgi:hypothetical protein